MVVVVDYGMGNLRSVSKAIEYLGKKVKISGEREVVKKAKKIIFPGVGHFGRAVKELKKRKLFNLLKSMVKEGIPFLGICLGMQLLLEESQEAAGIKGLGIIKGRVKKFASRNLIVPHMGWNRIRKTKDQRQKSKDLFKGIKDNSFFYFAHSYYCYPEEKELIATITHYGVNFPSSLHRDNLWTVQFHPEKSQRLGLLMLNNFLKLC